MSLTHLTECVIGATIVALIGYDVWVAVRGGEKVTISHVIAAASVNWPLIPFAAGLLCGHFFWPNP